MKISEAELIDNLRNFLIDEDLIDNSDSYFGGDDEVKADVELALNLDQWHSVVFKKLYIEAKSHHSTDSQNTINKIFGQLLKETGKRTLNAEKECLAILFPYESGEWLDNNRKSITRIEGVEYYRRGFSRIRKQAFVAFGVLVGAKYILSFSTTSSTLYVYEWENFLDSDFGPIISLTKKSRQTPVSLPQHI